MSAVTSPIPERSLEWKLPYRGKVGMAGLIVAESAIFTIFVVAYLFYLLGMDVQFLERLSAVVVGRGQSTRPADQREACIRAARFDKSYTPIPLKYLASCQIGGSR